MDLDDYHNNFYAGIHAANMAGTWQAIVNGFAGLYLKDGCLHFRPYLPEQWEGYEFHLRVKDCVLGVRIHGREAAFTLCEGNDLVFYVKEKKVQLNEQGGSYIENI